MATPKPWFVFAGGGSGGHLYPGLAVAEALRVREPNCEITVFGTARPIDRKLTGDRGIGLVVQQVRPLTKKPWEFFGFLAAWNRSVKHARQLFQKRAPAFVLGLGGYASAPPVVAAAKLGVPTAIFNPDALPGTANKWLAGKVDRIFTQWHDSTEPFDRSPKLHCTGCPIRSEFARVDRADALRALKCDPGRKTLLITGASQGSGSINAAVMEMMDFWKSLPDWQIVHLTGRADLEMCRMNYEEAGVDALTLGYTDYMFYCMAAADVILSRAGASTLAEITAMGLPSVLMPYPFDRKQHQLANAKVLVECGAAVLVEDAKDPVLNARRLREVFTSLIKGEHRRRAMTEAAGALGRHDAAQTIAEDLLELAMLD